MFDVPKNKSGMFSFDLEKELKDDHTKAKKLLKEIEEKEHKLKNAIRSGAPKVEFEKMGVFLKAYQALHKVVTRLAVAKGE
jgi:transcription termination factor NusB